MEKTHQRPVPFFESWPLESGEVQNVRRVNTDAAVGVRRFQRCKPYPRDAHRNSPAKTWDAGTHNSCKIVRGCLRWLT